MEKPFRFVSLLERISWRWSLNQLNNLVHFVCRSLIRVHLNSQVQQNNLPPEYRQPIDAVNLVSSETPYITFECSTQVSCPSSQALIQRLSIINQTPMITNLKCLQTQPSYITKLTILSTQCFQSSNSINHPKVIDWLPIDKYLISKFEESML
jgi:hypothetical protein